MKEAIKVWNTENPLHKDSHDRFTFAYGFKKGVEWAEKIQKKNKTKIKLKMKNELFKLFWEFAKSTYPRGTSTHVNAILEQDFDELIEKIAALSKIDDKDATENNQGQPMDSIDLTNIENKDAFMDFTKMKK